MLTHEEIILRLVAAAILGGVVGLERERLEWVAGLRTHMLVCLGAALVMIVSAYGFTEVVGGDVVLDPSRVAAQVVSGIGFLGAGTILFLRHEIIRGLTTAASLWTVAAVGLAIGGGLYLAAICTTSLILVILAVVKPLEQRLFRRHLTRRVSIRIDRRLISLREIESEIEASGLVVQQMTLRRGESPGEDSVDFMLLRSVKKELVDAMTAKLQAIDGVRSITV